MKKKLADVVNDERDNVTKEHDNKMCSLVDDEAKKLCSSESDDTYRDNRLAVKDQRHDETVVLMERVGDCTYEKTPELV